MDLLYEMYRGKCPTLIVAGEDDALTPIADTEDIMIAVLHHLVRIARFAGASHGVYGDLPEDFRVMREFIKM